MSSLPLYERARGRWRQILPQLNFPAALLKGEHGPCPMCGGTDRFRFDDRDGRGTYFCSGCGPGNGVELVKRINGWDFKTAAEKIEALLPETQPEPAKAARPPEDVRAALNRLWRSAEPIRAGDPVATYLAGRCIIAPHAPPVLRIVPSLRYGREEGAPRFPCMVARVQRPDGSPDTLHRTWIARDGAGKAPVASPRMLMPGGVTRGSAVRLTGPSSLMGVAEGIETALSAGTLFDVPTWSTLNSALLEAWEPPAECREVIVFGDRDEKFGGQAAAYRLAHRLATKNGLRVRVELPPRDGVDWNDVLCEVTKNARDD